MTELENVHMQQSQITQVTLGQRQFTKCILPYDYRSTGISKETSLRYNLHKTFIK